MSELNRYNRFMEFLLGEQRMYDYRKKPVCVGYQIRYMLNRTQKMFRWSGLPESIPQRIVELYLQTNGNVCFYKHDGELYVFCGGMGGEPDVYYMPTKYTIANPALKISKTLDIGKDCVVVPNDSTYTGLLPLLNRYITLLTETDLSLKIAVVNQRIVNLISAPDDRTKISAEKYLADIEQGNAGVIAENAFFDGIRSQVYGASGNSNNLTNLIECIQYLKASMYNELGLNANFNMKRESLNSAESALNNDILLPLVDDMLEHRKEGAEKVNAMFGTNITVEFASSWEDNEQEVELEHEQLGTETGGGEVENVERTG